MCIDREKIEINTNSLTISAHLNFCLSDFLRNNVLHHIFSFLLLLLDTSCNEKQPKTALRLGHQVSRAIVDLLSTCCKPVATFRC